VKKKLVVGQDVDIIGTNFGRFTGKVVKIKSPLFGSKWVTGRADSTLTEKNAVPMAGLTTTHGPPITLLMLGLLMIPAPTNWWAALGT